MICPVCQRFDEYCRCASESLTARTRKSLGVVSEHLYLLKPEELEHVIKIQKAQRVKYSDQQKMSILYALERGSQYEQTSFL